MMGKDFFKLKTLALYGFDPILVMMSMGVDGQIFIFY
jgi:hypothetical protein